MALPLLLLAIPILVGGAVGGYQYNQEKKKAKKLEKQAEAIQDAAKAEADRLMVEKKLKAEQHEAKERRFRNQNKRERRRAQAMYAKSGVLMEGTPKDFLVAQAKSDEFNAQESRRGTRYELAVKDWQAQNTLIAGDNEARKYTDAADGVMKKAKFNFAKTMVMSAAGGIAGLAGAGAAVGGAASSAATGPAGAAAGAASGAGGGVAGTAGGAAGTAATGGAGSAVQGGSTFFSKLGINLSPDGLFGPGQSFGDFAKDPRTLNVLQKSYNGAMNDDVDPMDFMSGLGSIF